MSLYAVFISYLLKVLLIRQLKYNLTETIIFSGARLLLFLPAALTGSWTKHSLRQSRIVWLSIIERTFSIGSVFPELYLPCIFLFVSCTNIPSQKLYLFIGYISVDKGYFVTEYFLRSSALYSIGLAHRR